MENYAQDSVLGMPLFTDDVAKEADASFFGITYESVFFFITLHAQR